MNNPLFDKSGTIHEACLLGYLGLTSPNASKSEEMPSKALQWDDAAITNSATTIPIKHKGSRGKH